MARATLAQTIENWLKEQASKGSYEHTVEDIRDGVNERYKTKFNAQQIRSAIHGQKGKIISVSDVPRIPGQQGAQKKRYGLLSELDRVTAGNVEAQKTESAKAGGNKRDAVDSDSVSPGKGDVSIPSQRPGSEIQKSSDRGESVSTPKTVFGGPKIDPIKKLDLVAERLDYVANEAMPSLVKVMNGAYDSFTVAARNSDIVKNQNEFIVQTLSSLDTRVSDLIYTVQKSLENPNAEKMTSQWQEGFKAGIKFAIENNLGFCDTEE